MRTPPKQTSGTNVWLYCLFVLALSFFTYVFHYQYPANPFWDEPYHIASAEKYLSGVFFMEQHPPLGKLLIAAGEYLVDGNDDDRRFIVSDYATNIPEDFNFAGHRLFPTLLGWLTAPVLFWIFLLFTRNSVMSALLSFLYVFDNAQIVHSRGAMVDSPLTFFGFLTLLLLLLVMRTDKKDLRMLGVLSLLAGLSFGAVMTTKLVGLVFILVFVWALWSLRASAPRMLTFVLCSLVGFVFVFVSVWHTHFSLGKAVQPTLSNEGYYQSSEAGKAHIQAGTSGSWSAFPTMLLDAMGYVSHYNKGVPRLDLCKENENGSPSFFWPIGAKTINYRWATDGSGFTRYLYLVPNPIGWMLGFAAVLLSSAFLLSSWLLGSKINLVHKNEMLMLLALYWGYMIAVSQLGRVMYLYHYFIPLNLSFLLVGLVLLNIMKIGKHTVTENSRVTLTVILCFAVFFSYQLYRPLSYYQPISDEQVEDRALLPLWELRCASCKRTNSIVVPKS
ncbi:MAG: phospholipid carrier-dependent glycosyltransferase [Candidatus Peribacteraceae bacterium]